MTEGVCIGKDGAVSGAQGHGTRPVEKVSVWSGSVRRGNKEIMAPRCVCSGTEGGEAAAAAGDDRSKRAGSRWRQFCALTRRKL